ncbi:uncharacterized protein LOC143422378 [Xylocopa sonorina]|uniref:uncharacterized protein LOC143422378 n=1 Tax=Xylocopa sonorina TaxID=1818115 RepID=UPI00403A7F9D
MAPDRQRAAQAKFKILVRLGIARPSESPWSSPLHMVKNRNDNYTANLAGSKIYSVIDLAQAFNHIPMAAEDIEKTAISTPFGFLNFYICHSVYDMLVKRFRVHSTHPQQHLEHHRQLLQRLDDHGIAVNRAKCVLGQEEVIFLGHIVFAAGVRPLSNKVEAIINYSLPTTARQLRRFLGMYNFYRRFVAHTATLQAPLEAALSSSGFQPVDMTEIRRTAFETCKAALSVRYFVFMLNVPSCRRKCLDLIAQYITGIRYISSRDNVVADALSSTNAVTTPVDLLALAHSQREHSEERSRPFITQPLSRKIFNVWHGLSYPGANATTKLTAQRFVWPRMSKDCPRFAHIHIDIIGLLSVSDSYRYCLTAMDKYTCWLEVILMTDITNEIVVEAYLFRELGRLVRFRESSTTAYYPCSNGIAERSYRTLKTAFMCYGGESSTDALPLVLLGLSAAWKDDTEEGGYGEPLRLLKSWLNYVHNLVLAMALWLRSSTGFFWHADHCAKGTDVLSSARIVLCSGVRLERRNGDWHQTPGRLILASGCGRWNRTILGSYGTCITLVLTHKSSDKFLPPRASFTLCPKTETHQK